MSGGGEHAALGAHVIEQAQTLHAIKAGALRMFESMIAAAKKERDRGELAEVQDLLEKMIGAFSSHEQTTRDLEARLRARLEALGADPAKARQLGLGLAASARAGLGRLGGQNYGANARDAFVFEHLEIATAELLELVARRAGDAETEALARDCAAADQEMAETIRRNLPNVLSLMLASKGLPTGRELDDAGPAPGGSPAEDS